MNFTKKLQEFVKFARKKPANRLDLRAVGVLHWLCVFVYCSLYFGGMVLYHFLYQFCMEMW